jgi:hypothetical protein
MIVILARRHGYHRQAQLAKLLVKPATHGASFDADSFDWRNVDRYLDEPTEYIAGQGERFALVDHCAFVIDDANRRVAL